MARLNTVKAARKPRTEGRGMPRCGKCGVTIQVGQPYLWWANRLPGARSGHKQVRCVDHRPSLAEMTPGRRGQLYQLQEDVSSALEAAASPADVIAAAEQAAEGLRDLAGELQESADNMESGFGHTTYQSEELAEKAQELERLADDLEAEVDEDDWPEDEEELTDQDVKDHLGEEDVTPEELAEARTELHQEQQEKWLEEARGKVTDKLEEAEV